MYGIWKLSKKFHWWVLLKYKNNTGATCEWMHNDGKYVMNGTDN